MKKYYEELRFRYNNFDEMIHHIQQMKDAGWYSATLVDEGNSVIYRKSEKLKDIFDVMNEEEYWKALFYKEHEAKKQAINDLTVTRREDLSKMKKQLLRYKKILDEIGSIIHNNDEMD